ncbi:MAG: hypothetical protein AABM29_05205 [Actinomycetota bacterium]
MNDVVSIWDKVAPTVEEPDEDEAGADDSGQETPGNKIAAIYSDPKWKWKRRALDAIGTLAWTYAFLKVFVFDVDREIVTSIAPGVEWLVDLRFFVVVAFFAIAVIALRPRSLLFAVLYVGFFPLVVMFWKLPRRLLRLKSWVATFAVINVATDLIAHFRYIVVGCALFLLSALAILGTDQNVLLAVAAAVLASLLTMALARTIWYSLKPSRFITMQEQGIERVLDSETLTSLTTLDDELTSNEVQQFDATQQGQFLMKVASSAAVNRALYFWGYQLDKYRRSSTAFLYSALSYVWLLTQAIVVLTLINWAIYKIDSSAFTFDDRPSLLVVARYSFSSMIGGEIGALQAHSDLANVVSLAGMFIGFGLLAGLFLTVILSFRREQQNAAIEGALVRIDQLGRELEVRHREMYELSIQATLDKLEELGYVLRGMATFFARRIPPGWRPGDEPGRDR